MRWHGGYNTRRSRLRIENKKENLYHKPVICNQCANAYCMNVCPANAYSRNDEGVVLIDENRCVGCGLCVQFCPEGMVKLDPETKKAVKCDTCMGDPLCVSACPTGALEWINKDKNKNKALCENPGKTEKFSSFTADKSGCDTGPARGSYMNKFLLVDLTTLTSRQIPLSPKMKQQYIGGKGFGARLLYDLLAPGTDPLGPDNVLMVMTGPLTGTMAPAMRGCIVTKSPLTHTFLDSYFGGHFAPEIKYAGYDGIIIQGKSDKPVYLWIDDDTVEIRDALHLRGKDTLTVNHSIKKELGDTSVRVASIGPAGENLVNYALIGCEYNRQAGRGGAGAVMGSKNLKAIAVRGSQIVGLNNPAAFIKACAKAQTELDASADIDAMKAGGTAGAVDYANETGLLPHKNYMGGTFEKSNKLSDIGQARHLWLGSSACMGCPIRCSKMGAVRTGKYKGIITDMLEYESAALMGANLDISDVRAVAHLVKLCDLLGIDSMSTGAVIGFAMELGEKGVLNSPEGVELKFGNIQAAEYLIKTIANQDSDLGKTLSLGVKKAAAIIGKDSKDIAVHVKGMEAPAWGPRGASGMGLAIMTADRGACHQRAFPIAYEVGGVEWKKKQMGPLDIVGKAELVYSLQNYSAGLDTLVKCDFGSFGISKETYGLLLEAATGQRVKKTLFDETGEKIWNLTRLFNLREGLDPGQDRLPRRFVAEALPDGPHKGHRISREDMDYMKQDYYSQRGWSKKGIPMESTLKRLGVEHNEPYIE